MTTHILDGDICSLLPATAEQCALPATHCSLQRWGWRGRECLLPPRGRTSAPSTCFLFCTCHTMAGHGMKHVTPLDSVRLSSCYCSWERSEGTLILSMSIPFCELPQIWDNPSRPVPHFHASAACGSSGAVLEEGGSGSRSEPMLQHTWLRLPLQSRPWHSRRCPVCLKALLQHIPFPSSRDVWALVPDSR